MEITSGKPKNNSNKRGVPQQMKALRQNEATQRAEAYSKLTPQQKLAKLDSGNFAAKKQRARLQKQIEGAKNV